MHGKRKAVSAQEAIVVVVLIAAVAFAVMSFSTSQRQQSPAKLSVSVTPFGATVGKSIQFPIQVANNGGDASQIAISLGSPALSGIAVNPVDVSSGQSVTVYATASVNDVQNGWHDISVSYTYKDVNGSHSSAGTNSRFYVIPIVSVTDFAWEGQPISINRFPAKDTIGKTDSTQFYFKVLSRSTLATYTQLSATTKTSPTAQGVTISPGSLQIEGLGPQGKTQEYSFKVQSSNTPPGKYNITIIIMSGDFEAAQHTVVLTVTS